MRKAFGLILILLAIGFFAFYVPALLNGTPAEVATSTPETATKTQAPTTGTAFAPENGKVAPNALGQKSSSFASRLKNVPIAYEAPVSAKLNTPFDIVLAVDGTGGDSAVDALPGTGNVVEGEAKVSEKIEARVSGAAFEIKALSPETQLLSPLTENVWRWSVTPKVAGEHVLAIEIFAIDTKGVVPLKTYSDVIIVEVTRLSMLVSLAQQVHPIVGVIAGGFSMLFGLLGLLRGKKSRKR